MFNNLTTPLGALPEHRWHRPPPRAAGASDNDSPVARDARATGDGRSADLPGTIRPLSAGDRDAVLAFYVGLSPRSRHQRFHSPILGISPSLSRILCAIDNCDHIAVGAFHAGALIGIARCIRSAPGSTAGEVAIAVADAQQGKGLGGGLLHCLALMATVRGFENFGFVVLADNRAAWRLLAGPDARPSLDDAGHWQGQVPVMAILARRAWATTQRPVMDNAPPSSARTARIRCSGRQRQRFPHSPSATAKATCRMSAAASQAS